jgi:hypothetical protein
MLKNINIGLNKLSLLKILSIYVAYSVVISATIQMYVLPVLFSQLHHGNGLLYGGDWYYYQSRATALWLLIADKGWDFWELRPRGHGLTGVIAAIYAFLGTNKPFVLIPFFSLLHGLGALSIFMLMEKIGVKRCNAFYSSIPYLIFPTSLLWVAQILKDVFTLNASLIILFGLVNLFNVFVIKGLGEQLKNHIFSIIIIQFGFILIWLVRPYMIEINLLFVILIFGIMDLKLFFFFLKRKISVVTLLIMVFAQFFLLTTVNFLPGNNSVSDASIKISPITTTKPITQSLENKEPKTQSLKNKDNAFNSIFTSGDGSRKLQFATWEKSNFLPERLDLELKKLYLNRSYFYLYNYESGSSIDYERNLNNFTNMLKYAPRAFQIGFLSPFPTTLFKSEYSSYFSKIINIVASIEIFFIYIFYIGLSIALFFWRKKIELWIIILFSLYFTLIPTYAFPNIGTLLRYRYAAIMILSAIGISGLIYLHHKLKTEKKG